MKIKHPVNLIHVENRAQIAPHFPQNSSHFKHFAYIFNFLNIIKIQEQKSLLHTLDEHLHRLLQSPSSDDCILAI